MVQRTFEEERIIYSNSNFKNIKTALLASHTRLNTVCVIINYNFWVISSIEQKLFLLLSNKNYLYDSYHYRDVKYFNQWQLEYSKHMYIPKEPDNSCQTTPTTLVKKHLTSLFCQLLSFIFLKNSIHPSNINNSQKLLFTIKGWSHYTLAWFIYIGTGSVN